MMKFLNRSKRTKAARKGRMPEKLEDKKRVIGDDSCHLMIRMTRVNRKLIRMEKHPAETIVALAGCFLFTMVMRSKDRYFIVSFREMRNVIPNLLILFRYQYVIDEEKRKVTE